MARLDSLIAALFAHHGEELFFRTGAGVTLKAAGGQREIMQKPLSAQQVEAVIREIMPETQSLPEVEGGASLFHYRAPSGEVQVLCERLQTHVRVKITPALEKPALEAAPALAPAAAPEILAGYTLDELLTFAASQHASDVHLRTSVAPTLRIAGELVPLQTHPPVDVGFLEAQLLPHAPPREAEAFRAGRDAQFAFEVHGIARARALLMRDRTGPAAIVHLAPLQVPTFEALGVSAAAAELLQQRKGLVLVASAAGMGKSTTLAAAVDAVNRTRPAHVLTVEDPIEYVVVPQAALVTQREVGTHCETAIAALRTAFRADVDVVAAGDLRDLDTVSAVVKLAEAGRFVLAATSAATAAQAVASVVERFPLDRQPLIRASLAIAFSGATCQVLVRRKGGGLVAAMEVLAASPEVRAAIQEGRFADLATRAGPGSVSLDAALADLVRRGLADEEEALRHANAPVAFYEALSAA